MPDDGVAGDIEEGLLIAQDQSSVQEQQEQHFHLPWAHQATEVEIGYLWKGLRPRKTVCDQHLSTGGQFAMLKMQKHLAAQRWWGRVVG